VARTAIPITDIAITGTPNVPGTAGDTVNNMEVAPNDGLVWLEVQNVSATTAFKFTLVIPGAVDGIEITDKELEVPKEKTEKFGPLPPEDFNNKGSAIFINPASAELKFSAYRL
jgi:hypothetical protein